MTGETVVLRSYAHEMEAEIAKSVLESAGIPSFIQRDDAGGMMPSLQFLRGARLIVRREDAEDATRVLDEQADADPTPIVEE